MSEERAVRMVSWQDRNALEATLSAAAVDGTLTSAMLTDAIYTHFDESDGPTVSVGAHWMYQYPGKCVRTLGDGLLVFLQEHANARYFLNVLIHSSDWIAAVSAEHRDVFWKDSYLAVGSCNDGWISAARRGGLAESVIQEMILGRLRAVTPEMMRYANDVDGFLSYGSGLRMDCDQAIRIRQEQTERGVPVADAYRPQFSNDCPWGVLTDDQFVEALEICAEKSPIRLVSIWRKLMLRTSHEVVWRLCKRVIKSATGLSWPAATIRPFSLEARLALANKMEPVTDFYLDSQVNVINFLLDCFADMASFAQESRVAFWANIERILAPANGAIVYLTMNKRREELEVPGMEVIVDIHAWLNAFLDRTGYKLGRIEEGTYRDRKSGQTRRQFQVWVGRMIYVQDRDSHRYFPRLGDQVLFRPAGGYMLMPTVVAVNFIPVDLSRES